MDKKEMLQLSATELNQGIVSGKWSSVEITEVVIDHIKEKDQSYNCYIHYNFEQALEQAKVIQNKIKDKSENLSPLAGVPIALKDNICTKGLTTTCGSQFLENFVPFYSATIVDKLEAAGAILLGKTNLDEFAMGSTTETSFFGPTKNPWNLDRVPGGSSGGSAAAVASQQAFLAIGSDTGGSIRQPSSYCGVTGIKPTYGTISRSGVVAYASSLDQIGPIGKDIIDCAHGINILSGQDPKDQTTVKTNHINVEEAKTASVKGMKIGIPEEYFQEGLQKDVHQKINQAIEILEKLGATVEKFSLPIVEYAVPTYYVIASAEASSNLARFDGIKYGYRAPEAKELLEIYYQSRSQAFGLEAKRRIMLGNFVLSSGYYEAYYQKALKARRVIKNTFDEAFKKYDLIIGPTTPTTAVKIGESLADPLKMYLGDIYTALVNIIGLPAASIPCGFDGQGLPVGMQIIGNSFQEQKIINLAAVFQRETNYHTQHPAE